MKRWILGFFILSVCAMPLRAEPGLTVTKILDMPEAVRLSYLNNPQLLASLEDISIAQQRLRMARHLVYPQLGLDANAVVFERERDFVVSEGLGGTILGPKDRRRLYLTRATIEQELYTGGRSKNAIVLARAALEQAEISRHKIQRQIALDVKLHFVDYLLSAERETLLARWNTTLEGIRPSGAEAAARLLWEDRQIDWDLGLTQIRSQILPQNRAELLRSIGMDLYSEIKVAGALSELKPKGIPPLTTALTWARELRPEYRSQALSSEMDATQVAIALAGRNPIVSLAGTYEFLGREYPLDTENWAWMMRVHLPLSWDSWTTIRERRAQRRKGQVLRVDIEDQISSEVRRSHANLSYSLSRLEKEKARLGRWRELYGQAVRSASSTLRLELAQRYFQVEAAWLEAQAAALKATYELEYAIGKDLE